MKPLDIGDSATHLDARSNFFLHTLYVCEKLISAKATDHDVSYRLDQ